MSALTINAEYILPVKTDPIKTGSIVISEGKIQSISNHLEKTNSNNLLLIPGLVNAHTHLELSGMPSLSSPTSFSSWANKIIEWRKNQTSLTLTSSIIKGIEIMVQGGVTCFGDYSTTGISYGELSDRGLKGRVFLEFTGFKKDQADLRLDDLKKNFSTLKKNSDCLIGIAPHAPYSVSPSLLKKSFLFAKEQNIPFSTHLSEHEEEEKLISGKGGSLKKFMLTQGLWDESWISPDTTPVRYLLKLGLLNKLIGIHLNRIDTEEIAILKENCCSVIFCPGSTLWFKRKKYCPVTNLMKNGITVALGTDSLASNNELSMLREMRLVKKMFPSLSFEKILEMATVNGARVFGLDNVTGFLKEGMDADIVGIKMDQTYSSPYDALFGTKSKVQFVMAKGKIVFGKN